MMDLSEYLDETDIKPNFGVQIDDQNQVEFELKDGYCVNKYINRYLRDYQRDGVKFLFQNYEANMGCILADDMGLGKTIQVIGFLAAALNKTGKKVDLVNRMPDCVKKELNFVPDKNAEPIKPFLIACPGAVLYNWIEELDKWGFFAVGKYHSTECKDTLNKAKRNRLDIVLTTHETCRDHIDHLKDVEWNAIIVDECHKIKEEKANMTMSFKKFKIKKRIGLSGSILQNNLIELWCLLDWVNPRCLGTSKEFQRKYAKFIENGQKADASKHELAIKLEKGELLKEITDKWVLRRNKTLLADQLPKKIDQIVYCKLSELQFDLYEEILGMYASGFYEKKLVELKIDDELSKDFVFTNVLMKLVNHPGLLLVNYGKNADEIRKTDIILVELFTNMNETKRELQQKLHDPLNCGKMRVLISILKKLKNENAKVLLFSYSVKLLDILQQYAIDQSYLFTRLDGSTDNKQRLQTVNRFNQDKSLFLFLISTKAGGVGLNITGANAVVIFDPNFNPTHDLQALDRAYRIGQTRDVQMYRLISNGCIEENIYLRQLHKMSLNNELVENDVAKRLFKGSKQARAKSELFGIDNLFALNKTDECLTKSIFERNLMVDRQVAGLSDANEPKKPTKKRKSADMNEFLDTDNVVFVCNGKQVLQTSKIEKHIRLCAKEDNNTRELASAVSKRPQLNTLDYIELDSSYISASTGEYDSRNVKVIYGSTPVHVKREHFIQMAKMLNKSTTELANFTLSLSKEERFYYLKQFYLNKFPQTKEFFESFSSRKDPSDEQDKLSSDKKQAGEVETKSRFDTLLDGIDLSVCDDEDAVGVNASALSIVDSRYDQLMDDIFNIEEF